MFHFVFNVQWHYKRLALNNVIKKDHNAIAFLNAVNLVMDSNIEEERN